MAFGKNRAATAAAVAYRLSPLSRADLDAARREVGRDGVGHGAGAADDPGADRVEPLQLGADDGRHGGRHHRQDGRIDGCGSRTGGQGVRPVGAGDDEDVLGGPGEAALADGDGRAVAVGPGEAGHAVLARQRRQHLAALGRGRPA